MCNPAAALLVFKVVQTVASYEEQRSTANKQVDAVKDAYRTADAQAQERYRQVNADAAEKQSERARQAAIERSRIAVASGESGLGGLNTARLEGEAEGAFGRDSTRIASDRLASQRATELEMQGVRAKAQSDLNKIKYPSLVQSGLQIAGAFGDYKRSTGTNKANT